MRNLPSDFLIYSINRGNQHDLFGMASTIIRGPPIIVISAFISSCFSAKEKLEMLDQPTIVE